MLYDKILIDELMSRTDLVHRTLVILGLVIIFAATGAGQETPKAVLVDEFGSVSCEDLLARHDALLAELSQNPNDVGFAVIYADGRNPKGFVKFLTANLFMRRFDRSRMRIVLAEGKGDMVNGSFWRIPEGSQGPDVKEVPIPKPDLSRPFAYGQDYSDNVCPSFSPDLFAELILKSPGSKARVVVTGSDWLQRKAAAEGIVKSLTSETELSRNRIEFYFVDRPDLDYTLEEYWFIPPRRR